MDAEATTPEAVRTLSDRSVHMPPAPRVMVNPKAKIFTFEGLTPVSTLEDVREETISVGDSSIDRGQPVVRDDGCDASSPLTLDHSLDQEEEETEQDNVLIVKESSTFKEKIAAWERQMATWCGSDVDEVPFDEDPMVKVASAKSTLPTADEEHLQSTIGAKESPQENMTEIFVKEEETSWRKNTTIADGNSNSVKGRSETVNEGVKETLFSNSGTRGSFSENVIDVVPTDTVEEKVLEVVTSFLLDQEGDSAVAVEEKAPEVVTSNLLDQEDEIDILPIPSDEIEEVSLSILNNCAEKRSLADNQIFGCPDEIFTQVSQYLTLNTSSGECCSSAKP